MVKLVKVTDPAKVKEIREQSKQGFILVEVGRGFRRYFNAKNPTQCRIIADALVGDPTDTWLVAAIHDDTFLEAGTNYKDESWTYLGGLCDCATTCCQLFCRWSIDIPDGATITSAYVKLNSRGESNAGNDFTAHIYLVDQDSCPDFNTDPSAHGLVGDVGGWAIDISAWDVADVWFTSPDIKTLVQSFIDRGGYSPNNYIGLKMCGTDGASSDYVSVMGYGAAPARAEKLEVTYTVGGIAHEKTLTESLGLSDKVVKAPALLKTEPLGLLDTYSKTWAIYRNYSEILGLSDTVIATRTLVKVLTELLGLSDTVRKDTSKVLTENLGLLDVYDRTWSVYRTYDELLGLADSIKKDIALHPLIEPLGLVDGVVKSPSITRDELLGLKDSIVKNTLVTRTELLGLLDTITKGVSLPLSEILGLLDTYDRVLAVQRTYTEVLGLEDRLSKHPSKALVEVLGLLDSISYSKNPTVLAKLIRKYLQLVDIGGGEEV